VISGEHAFTFRVCSAAGQPIADVCDVAHSRHNAPLLAAAPELLAALIDVLSWAKSSHGAPADCDCARCEVVHIARAAIAEAKGGKP
jgi:hypothetical protein